MLNDEEMKELELTQEQLEKDLNEMGTREDNLATADPEMVKTVLECGGLDALDAYLDSTWHAWICASDLIKVVDSLFYVDPCDHHEDSKRYENLVNKATKAVFDSMRLALTNAETEILYDHDPHEIAEDRIRGFGDGLAHDLRSISPETQS